MDARVTAAAPGHFGGSGIPAHGRGWKTREMLLTSISLVLGLLYTHLCKSTSMVWSHDQCDVRDKVLLVGSHAMSCAMLEPILCPHVSPSKPWMEMYCALRMRQSWPWDIERHAGVESGSGVRKTWLPEAK